MKAKTEREAIAQHAPWKPPAFEPADAGALQALARGTATADQQKRALDWIVKKACATYDFAYRPGPDGERDTLIALGRQMVGQQVVKLLHVKIGSLPERRSE